MTKCIKWRTILVVHINQPKKWEDWNLGQVKEIWKPITKLIVKKNIRTISQEGENTNQDYLVDDFWGV